MEIRERLLAFAAGSPIGGARRRANRPYDEFEYDERPTSFGDRVLRFATVSVLMLVVACAIATIAYAAQKGQWNVNLGVDNMNPERTQITIRWSDIDKDKYVSFEHGGIKAYKIGYTITTTKDGSTVEGPVYYDKNGKVVDKSHSKMKKYNGSLQGEDLKKNFEPSWAPDGWEKGSVCFDEQQVPTTTISRMNRRVLSQKIQRSWTTNLSARRPRICPRF